MLWRRASLTNKPEKTDHQANTTEKNGTNLYVLSLTD